MRTLIQTSAVCRRPEMKEIETLMTPFQTDIEAISRLKEANRKDRNWYTHLTVIGEGAPVVGWVLNVSDVANSFRMHLMLYAGQAWPVH